MARKSALEKIIDEMKDGQERTVRRVHYLTGLSLNAVRKALAEGHLVKVGEEPCPSPWARRGQAIVKLAPKHLPRQECSRAA